jgi:hypothetical protein
MRYHSSNTFHCVLFYHIQLTLLVITYLCIKFPVTYHTNYNTGCLKIIVLYLFSATALNSSIISTTADKSIIVHHVPQCSNNRTFCEDVDFYPEIHFEEILQSSSYSYGKEYFASQNHTSLTNRLYSKKENYLCSSSVKRQYPRVGYNVNKKWRFIYNLHGYKQGIVTEECV